MQIETQRYRGYTRTGTLTAETAAECRFGGEVETVLAAQAAFVPPPGQAFDLTPETLRLTVLDETRADEVTGCPLR